MRIKQEHKGSSTYSKILGGLVKVEDKHLDLFLKEGRYDLIEGTPHPKKLQPIKTMGELRKEAKGLEGYSNKLTKQELIDLINEHKSNTGHDKPDVSGGE